MTGSLAIPEERLDRTGQCWLVWSGPMLVIGPAENADRLRGPRASWEEDFIEHPCLNLESGRRFTYAEFVDVPFEGSPHVERMGV